MASSVNRNDDPVLEDETRTYIASGWVDNQDGDPLGETLHYAWDMDDDGAFDDGGGGPGIDFTLNDWTFHDAGPHRVRLKVTDPDGGETIAERTFDVQEVNDAPVARNATVVVNEDTTGSFALPFTDEEGGSMTCTLLVPPIAGQATVASHCTGATYTPAADSVEDDTFMYRVIDGPHIGSGNIGVDVVVVSHAPRVTGAADVTVLEDAGTVTMPGWMQATPDRPTRRARL